VTTVTSISVSTTADSALALLQQHGEPQATAVLLFAARLFAARLRALSAGCYTATRPA
jgi:hypothetical protein